MRQAIGHLSLGQVADLFIHQLSPGSHGMLSMASMMASSLGKSVHGAGPALAHAGWERFCTSALSSLAFLVHLMPWWLVSPDLNQPLSFKWVMMLSHSPDRGLWAQ